MRLIYLTDIHGAFEDVKNLLIETLADVYIISGDIIDIPFYNMETAIAYHEIQSYFNSLRRQMNRDNILLEDFVDDLMDDPGTKDEIIEKGTNYLHYTIRARRVMQQKYKLLANICDAKNTSGIFLLPGNYDMDLKYTSLFERDLHLHSHRFGSLKIAGYGGADVFTAGIPERYIIQYRAGKKDPLPNEMTGYFDLTRPDIIVTHKPAQGIHDWIPHIGPSGSPSLRTWCDSNDLLLCLTGHVHDSWGMQYIGNTVYLNPSNFGDVTTIQAEVAEGGFFYQVEIENQKIDHIVFRKIVANRIYDLMEYYPYKNGYTETIIDLERVNALRRRENYDMKMKKYTHIPEIILHNEIRQFFRSFQTRETEDRLDKLERVVKLLEGYFETIAMDVMGSVNFGLSQPQSDIDMVLYLRCGRSCDDNQGYCPTLETARQMIHERLGDKYKFQIIDCVDLTLVEKSIREKNYECEATQRFLTHRLMGRPINYRVIAPVEDLLNTDMEFRKELEGSIQAFFKIFTNTSQHVRSFEKYELRLQSLGIRIPDAIREKIRDYFSNPPVEKS